MTETLKILHGFSGSCAPDGNNWIKYENFSLGIFELIRKKGKNPNNSIKHGPVKVRVSGRTSNQKAVYDKAREIVTLLDAGTYQGPKNVRVK